VLAQIISGHAEASDTLSVVGGVSPRCRFTGAPSVSGSRSAAGQYPFTVEDSLAYLVTSSFQNRDSGTVAVLQVWIGTDINQRVRDPEFVELRPEGIASGTPLFGVEKQLAPVILHPV